MFGLSNKKLVAISIGISVVGLLILYLLSLFHGAEKIKISEIDADMIGSTVSIYGTIKSKTKSDNGHMFLKISDGEGEIDVVIFSNVMKYFDDESEFKKGRKISVKGSVDEYKGKLEIVPRKADDIGFGG